MHLTRIAGARLGLAGIALAMASCGSCQGTSTSDPRLHLPADAAMVVELPEVAALPELWKQIEARAEGVLPAEDLMNARTELQRVLGLDPFTEEGLRAAGVAAKGAVVGHASEDSALFILPVEDSKLFGDTVANLVAARAYAEKSETKLAGKTASVFSRSFGEETASVAAMVVDGGRGFVAVGPESVTMLEAALTQKKEAALPTSENYRALVEQLGEPGLVRVVMPGAGQALRDTMAKARSKVPMALDEKTAAGIRGAAWQLRVTSSGVTTQGRLHLEGEALAAAKKLFAEARPLPEGLRQVDIPGAVVHLVISADPQALLERIAPENSRARARLARLLESLGLEEKEVLDGLSGQLALATGFGPALAEADLRTVMGNPLSLAWTTIGLGKKKEAKLGEVTEKMKSQLAQRSFGVKAVKVGEQPVTRIVSQANPDFVLVDTVVRDDSVLYANEPAVTEAVLGLAPAPDPLKGKPGAMLELRMGTLADQLKGFDLNKLPLMFRGLVTKGLEALAAFDRLQVVLQPTDTGIAIDSSLDLRPVGEAKTP